MNFRNSHLNIEKVNLIRQKKWWSGFPSPVHILKSHNYHNPVALILILNPSTLVENSFVYFAFAVFYSLAENPSSAMFNPGDKPMEVKDFATSAGEFF